MRWGRRAADGVLESRPGDVGSRRRIGASKGARTRLERQKLRWIGAPSRQATDAEQVGVKRGDRRRANVTMRGANERRPHGREERMGGQEKVLAGARMLQRDRGPPAGSLCRPQQEWYQDRGHKNTGAPSAVLGSCRLGPIELRAATTLWFFFWADGLPPPPRPKHDRGQFAKQTLAVRRRFVDSCRAPPRPHWPYYQVPPGCLVSFSRGPLFASTVRDRLGPAHAQTWSACTPFLRLCGLPKPSSTPGLPSMDSMNPRRTIILDLVNRKYQTLIGSLPENKAVPPAVF